MDLYWLRRVGHTSWLQAPWLALSLCSLWTSSAQQWGRADDCHSHFQMRELTEAGMAVRAPETKCPALSLTFSSILEHLSPAQPRLSLMLGASF